MKSVNYTNHITISSKNSIFKDTIFLLNEKSRLLIDNSSVEFINCKFIFVPKYGTQDALLMYVSNSKVKLTHSFMINGDTAIQSVNSKLILNSCRIIHSRRTAISTEKSDLILLNCNIYQNGLDELSYPQILVFNSVIFIDNSKIYKSTGAPAIYCEDSVLRLKKSYLFENTSNALFLQNTKFSIDSCNIYDNGRQEEDFSQIYIEHSNGMIMNSNINNGIDADGIHIYKVSKVKIHTSSIFHNEKNGISVEGESNIILDGCNIYENGQEDYEYAQIWIDNATALIANSKIFNARNADGVYGQKISKIHIENCEIFRNKTAISIFEKSSININNTDIYKNGFSNAQIWLEDSNAYLLNCKISSGDSKGLYATDMSVLIMENVLCFNNKDSGISLDEGNHNIHLKNVKSYNNTRGFVSKSPLRSEDSLLE